MTWEHEQPEVLTTEYLNKYFSQSVFGNSSSRFLQERLSYNSNILGGLGYGIYVKSGGSLSEVAFTTEKSYTYQGGSGSVELVVKAEYRNFKNNASDGVSVKGTASGSSDTGNSSNDSGTLIVNLNDAGGNYTVGSYLDSGVTVLYNNQDVTGNADISYYLGGTKYSSQKELEDAVNANGAGSIKITYEVKYKGETKKVSKNITLT